MIVKMLPVGPLQANCYIAGCEKTRQAVVIDPGDEAQRILRAIQDLGLTASGIPVSYTHLTLPTILLV